MHLISRENLSLEDLTIVNDEEILQKYKSLPKLNEMIHEVLPPPATYSFCAKRFNRYPRFSYVVKERFDQPTVNIIMDGSKTDEFPFNAVVLQKQIDNQILTSFRTPKGQNNQITSTQKVVHR